MSRKFGYVSVSRFPLQLNGANIATIELLDYLRFRNNEVCMINFYTTVPAGRFISGRIQPIGTREGFTHMEASFAGLLKHLEYHEELLPVAVFDSPERYRPVVKRVIDVVKESGIDHTISHGNDFYSLIGACLIDVPGCFFFHSVSGIREAMRHELGLKLLRTRTVFSASCFLQSRLRELLDMDTIVWYPLFKLGGPGRRKTDHISRTIGYYAAGEYKGDAVVNRIMKAKREWQFVVVGPRYALRCGEEAPNLTVWGHTADLKGFYDTIDLMIAPSLMEEGFSRVVLEACAYGIPVIANRVGGIPEAMGGGGILIDVDLRKKFDLDAIANRYIDEIERLFSNPEYYRVMSEKAALRAEEYETEQRILSDTNYRKYMA